MPIPRYIHYCWFGNKPIPKIYKKYMKTWEKFCPGYKFMLWNEENFPIEKYKYAAEAYKEGKMAFVSDVARIYALEKYGGIYLDTDVEIIRPLDDVLKGYSAVLGWESIRANTMGTGFIAVSKGHMICEKMLEYYEKHPFKIENDKFDTKSNTKILAELIEREYGLKPGLSVEVKGDMIIYPRSYFTAFNTVTKECEVTENTYCIHHFAASWFSPWKKLKRHLKIYINRILKCFGKRI